MPMIIIVLLGVVAACIDSFNCYNNLMLVFLELILSGIYIYMSSSLKFLGSYVLHTCSQTWLNVDQSKSKMDCVLVPNLQHCIYVTGSRCLHL